FEIARGWGSSGAALVACFHVTALEHSGVIAENRKRIAAIAGGSVVPLYFVVTALGIGVAMLVARVILDLSPWTFFTYLERQDFAYGTLTALVLGIVPFAWTFACKCLLASTRSLAGKLFVTWVGALAASAALNLTASSLLPNDDSPQHRLGGDVSM